MSYKICYIKNISGASATLNGRVLTSNEEYQITDNLRHDWANNDDVISAITDDDFQIGNGTSYITSYSDQLDWLKSDVPPEVQTTMAKNETSLKPYGITSMVIDASSYVSTITLSGKSGTTYSYTGTDPAVNDCLTQGSGHLRDGVLSVDTQAKTVTLYYGVLANGSTKLSKPIILDYKLPSDYSTYLIYGSYVSAFDYGEQDVVRMQIVDVDNILGAGAGYIVSEYDELWVDHADKLTKLITPSTPGEVPGLLYLRLKYYPKDVSKTNIRLYVDYIVEVKD